MFLFLVLAMIFVFWIFKTILGQKHFEIFNSRPIFYFHFYFILTVILSLSFQSKWVLSLFILLSSNAFFVLALFLLLLHHRKKLDDFIFSNVEGLRIHLLSGRSVYDFIQQKKQESEAKKSQYKKLFFENVLFAQQNIGFSYRTNLEKEVIELIKLCLFQSHKSEKLIANFQKRKKLKKSLVKKLQIVTYNSRIQLIVLISTYLFMFCVAKSIFEWKVIGNVLVFSVTIFGIGIVWLLFIARGFREKYDY